MMGISLNNKIPQVLITIILFSEFVTKIYGFHLNDFYVSLSFFVKISFVLFTFSIVLRNYKDQLSKYLICLFIYLLLELVIYKVNVKIDFYIYSIRYLYFLLLIIFLKTYNNSSRNEILKFLDFSLLVNSLLIIIGAGFHLYFFETYRGGRLGYNGIINMVSDTNYIYGFYILVNIFNPIIGRAKTIVFVNILVAILTGTKTVIFLAILFLVINLIKFNKKLFYVLVGLFTTGAILFKDVLIKNLSILVKEHLWIYKDQGLLSSLTSTRFYNLTNSFKNILNGELSIIDIFLYNRKFISYRVEMELFDVVFFWGVLGAILFLYIFYKVNMLIVSKKDRIILVCIFIISCFAGKLLTNFTSLLIMYSFFTSRPTILNEKN